MIIYVTGRPDMQKHRVVAWLSQHNFPHGAVSFCDGLTHDPLRQKAAFLQSLRTEVGARGRGVGSGGLSCNPCPSLSLEELCGVIRGAGPAVLVPGL